MGPPAPRSPTSLLRRFSDLQAQRAQAYSRFDAGFRRYLDTAQEGIYRCEVLQRTRHDQTTLSFRKLLAEMTVQFQTLSQGVREVEAALRDAGHDDLAALLRQVQEQEREKLQSTLALQALRAARAHKRLGWQDGDDEGVGAENTPHCAGHHHHSEAGHACSPPAAPSKAEYEAALGEAIRSLQSTVTTINGLLEEVHAAAEPSDDEGDAGAAA